MSFDCSIIIALDAKYDQINIKNILIRGDALGFIYREFRHNMDSLNDAPISIECAMHKIIEGTADNMHSLLIEMDSTYAYIHFIEYPNSLTITLSGLCIIWSKKFYDGKEGLDVGRCAKALLELVSDYRIFEMRIEHD